MRNMHLIPFKATLLGYYFLRKLFHIGRYFFDVWISKLFFNITSVMLKNDNTIPSKENLCIFSHYDPHNIIDDYVIYYLKALADCQCDIIFVSTCQTLPENEVSKINNLCKRILLKTNRGLDFSAYRLGLLTEKNLQAYLRILLTNDSVYGPFFDLKKIIAFGDSKHLDMWGTTDSYMIKYHIQSYFIVFSRSLFLSRAFHDFWNNVQNLGIKNNIIIRYEIGMSQFFLNNNFKLGAYSACPTFDTRINHDPSHHAWDKLILENKHPFIKRIFLRENPHDIPNQHWESVIHQASYYDTRLIRNHLIRTN